MRIAVTGLQGQVTRSLIERAKQTSEEVVPVGRPEIDLAGDRGTIARAIAGVNPDVVVSAAAYTAVDRAESEKNFAFAVNAAGADAVAHSAASLGVPLVHLSTDYVFDGRSPVPYVETDATNPASVYGSSKLAGEQAVLARHSNSVILRTAWVYSPFGVNFVKTMLRVATDRNEVAVVADQLGNPTNALDIADGILQIARNLAGSGEPALRGIFHMTAAGEATWADFAEAIFAASNAEGGPTATVRRITAAEFPTPATRPANSRLDSSKLREVHRVSLPDWRSSLPQVVRRLVLQATEKISWK